MNQDHQPRATGSRVLEWIDLTPAELARAVPAGVVVGGIGMFAAAVAGMPALVAIVAGGAGFAVGILGVRAVARGAAYGLAATVLPSGDSTPSSADYSREDALLMQRDVAGALASFEAKIAADPRLVSARLRAADLYAGAGADS